MKVTNTGASWIEYVHINEIPDLQHVDIVSVTWSGGPNNESNITAKEVSPGVWEIAGDDTKDLCAGHTDTYSVVVKFKLKTGETIDKIGPCVVKNGTYSGGFINKVSADGETGTDSDNTACESPEPQITIKKLGRNCDTDKKVCSLAGASFALYDRDPSGWYPHEVTDGITADASGSVFTSAALDPNTDYWLVETKAPAGHELMATPIRFRINEVTNSDGKVTGYAIALQNQSSLGSGDTAAAAVATGDALELDVYDPTAGKLPVAGTKVRIAWLLIGVALSLIIFGALSLVERQRKERE